MIKKYKITKTSSVEYQMKYQCWEKHGFQGVQKQYVNIRLPHKKPKGGELTPEQKQENRELAQERVFCENAFSGVKRYNAVSDIYRNRVPKFDDKLMLTACGLWNFYLEAA